MNAGPPRARTGLSLLELLAAMIALAVIATVAAALFRLQTRVASAVAWRAEALDGARTATALAGRELRFLAHDDAAVHADSVALRAFRGVAIVCDIVGTRAIVRYEGIRDPDPTKDSLLVLSGSTGVAGLSSSAPATSPKCAPRGAEVVLALDALLVLQAGAAVAVFERGAYSLASGSFRYRRGAGGRQPVTAPVFQDGASGFGIEPPSTAAGAAATLGLAPAAATVAPGLALPAAVRVAQPNADTLEQRP